MKHVTIKLDAISLDHSRVRESKFLFIQHRRIGDVLMCTPSIRALRRAHPEARIDFLTEPESEPVLSRNPHLSNVVVSLRGFVRQAGLIARLRETKYDAAIDFFGSPRSARVCRLSGAPRRIGFPYRGRRFAYTETVSTPPRAYAARAKLALAARLGADEGDWAIEFPIDDEDCTFARRLWSERKLDDERVVALFAASRRPYKVWPVERFAAVADALVSEFGLRVLLVWGPGEEESARRLARLAEHGASFVSDYPTPSLRELRGMIERCVLFVGNDSGPKHVAVAAGVPTVAVFGPTDPLSWTPPDDPRHVAVSARLDCVDACDPRRCRRATACLELVTVEMVLDGVRSALAVRV